MNLPRHPSYPGGNFLLPRPPPNKLLRPSFRPCAPGYRPRRRTSFHNTQVFRPTHGFHRPPGSNQYRAGGPIRRQRSHSEPGTAPYYMHDYRNFRHFSPRHANNNGIHRPQNTTTIKRHRRHRRPGDGNQHSYNRDIHNRSFHSFENEISSYGRQRYMDLPNDIWNNFERNQIKDENNVSVKKEVNEYLNGRSNLINIECCADASSSTSVKDNEPCKSKLPFLLKHGSKAFSSALGNILQSYGNNDSSDDEERKRKTGKIDNKTINQCKVDNLALLKQLYMTETNPEEDGTSNDVSKAMMSKDQGELEDCGQPCITNNLVICDITDNKDEGICHKQTEIDNNKIESDTCEHRNECNDIIKQAVVNEVIIQDDKVEEDSIQQGEEKEVTFVNDIDVIKVYTNYTEQMPDICTSNKDDMMFALHRFPRTEKFQKQGIETDMNSFQRKEKQGTITNVDVAMTAEKSEFVATQEQNEYTKIINKNGLIEEISIGVKEQDNMNIEEHEQKAVTKVFDENKLSTSVEQNKKQSTAKTDQLSGKTKAVSKQKRKNTRKVKICESEENIEQCGTVSGLKKPPAKRGRPKKKNQLELELEQKQEKERKVMMPNVDDCDIVEPVKTGLFVVKVTPGRKHAHQKQFSDYNQPKDGVNVSITDQDKVKKLSLQLISEKNSLKPGKTETTRLEMSGINPASSGKHHHPVVTTSNNVSEPRETRTVLEENKSRKRKKHILVSNTEAEKGTIVTNNDVEAMVATSNSFGTSIRLDNACMTALENVVKPVDSKLQRIDGVGQYGTNDSRVITAPNKIIVPLVQSKSRKGRKLNKRKQRTSDANTDQADAINMVETAVNEIPKLNHTVLTNEDATEKTMPEAITKNGVIGAMSEVPFIHNKPEKQSKLYKRKPRKSDSKAMNKNENVNAELSRTNELDLNALEREDEYNTATMIINSLIEPQPQDKQQGKRTNRRKPRKSDLGIFSKNDKSEAGTMDVPTRNDSNMVNQPRVANDLIENERQKKQRKPYKRKPRKSDSKVSNKNDGLEASAIVASTPNDAHLSGELSKEQVNGLTNLIHPVGKHFVKPTECVTKELDNFHTNSEQPGKTTMIALDNVPSEPLDTAVSVVENKVQKKRTYKRKSRKSDTKVTNKNDVIEAETIGQPTNPDLNIEHCMEGNQNGDMPIEPIKNESAVVSNKSRRKRKTPQRKPRKHELREKDDIEDGSSSAGKQTLNIHGVVIENFVEKTKERKRKIVDSEKLLSEENKDRQGEEDVGFMEEDKHYNGKRTRLEVVNNHIDENRRWILRSRTRTCSELEKPSNIQNDINSVDHVKLLVGGKLTSSPEKQIGTDNRQNTMDEEQDKNTDGISIQCMVDGDVTREEPDEPDLEPFPTASRSDSMRSEISEEFFDVFLSTMSSKNDLSNENVDLQQTSRTAVDVGHDENGTSEVTNTGEILSNPEDFSSPKKFSEIMKNGAITEEKRQLFYDFLQESQHNGYNDFDEVLSPEIPFEEAKDDYDYQDIIINNSSSVEDQRKNNLNGKGSPLIKPLQHDATITDCSLDVSQLSTASTDSTDKTRSSFDEVYIKELLGNADKMSEVDESRVEEESILDYSSLSKQDDVILEESNTVITSQVNNEQSLCITQTVIGETENMQEATILDSDDSSRSNMLLSQDEETLATEDNLLRSELEQDDSGQDTVKNDMRNIDTSQHVSSSLLTENNQIKDNLNQGIPDYQKAKRNDDMETVKEPKLQKIACEEDVGKIVAVAVANEITRTEKDDVTATDTGSYDNDLVPLCNPSIPSTNEDDQHEKLTTVSSLSKNDETATIHGAESNEEVDKLTVVSLKNEVSSQVDSVVNKDTLEPDYMIETIMTETGEFNENVPPSSTSGQVDLDLENKTAMQDSEVNSANIESSEETIMSSLNNIFDEVGLLKKDSSDDSESVDSIIFEKRNNAIEESFGTPSKDGSLKIDMEYPSSRAEIDKEDNMDDMKKVNNEECEFAVNESLLDINDDITATTERTIEDLKEDCEDSTSNISTLDINNEHKTGVIFEPATKILRGARNQDETSTIVPENEREKIDMNTDIPENKMNDDIPKDIMNDDIPKDKMNNDIPEDKMNDDIPKDKMDTDISGDKMNDDIPKYKMNKDIPEDKMNTDIPEDKLNTDICEDKMNTDICEDKMNNDIRQAKMNNDISEDKMNNDVIRDKIEHMVEQQLTTDTSLVGHPVAEENREDTVGKTEYHFHQDKPITIVNTDNHNITIPLHVGVREEGKDTIDKVTNITTEQQSGDDNLNGEQIVTKNIVVSEKCLNTEKREEQLTNLPEDETLIMEQLNDEVEQKMEEFEEDRTKMIEHEEDKITECQQEDVGKRDLESTCEKSEEQNNDTKIDTYHLETKDSALEKMSSTGNQNGLNNESCVDRETNMRCFDIETVIGLFENTFDSDTSDGSLFDNEHHNKIHRDSDSKLDSNIDNHRDNFEKSDRGGGEKIEESGPEKPIKDKVVDTVCQQQQQKDVNLEQNEAIVSTTSHGDCTENDHFLGIEPKIDTNNLEAKELCIDELENLSGPENKSIKDEVSLRTNECHFPNNNMSDNDRLIEDFEEQENKEMFKIAKQLSKLKRCMKKFDEQYDTRNDLDDDNEKLCLVENNRETSDDLLTITEDDQIETQSIHSQEEFNLLLPEEDSCSSRTDDHMRLVDEYSSSSTTTVQSDDSYKDSVLKVTLITEIDHETGKKKWLPRKSDKAEITGIKRQLSSSSDEEVLEQRLTRASKKIDKNSRICFSEFDENLKSPKSLAKLSLRPVAEYIERQEAFYWENNESCSKKRRISNEDSSSEDEILQLSNMEVMYEIAEKAFGKDKVKKFRCSTPRTLFVAAKQGNPVQVLVLAAGCNVNSTVPQENHKTAMHAAAAAGHLSSLRILHMVGGNLSLLDSNLRTPLFDAVENNHLSVVKFLIDNKVNVALKDSNGMTVLHIAAQKSYVDIINLLMETRAIDIDEQDSGGWTALMWTAESKHVKAARCLLKWGASVHKQDKELNTCLHWASMSGASTILQLFLETNAYVNSTNQFGATALHISARERKLQNLKVLEQYYPNVEIRNADNKTAIQLVPLKSKCYLQLENMIELHKIRKRTVVERLVTSDVSRGQEYRPIPCVNEVDNEDLPDDFVYVHKSCEGPDISFNRIAMTGCACSDGCVNEKKCECAQLSARKRFWYDESGLISKEIFKAKDRPLLYECNIKCHCWTTCTQRVVQNGIKVSLQVYKTKKKGWAVRSQALIPAGTFVCEYVGEILTDSEADQRSDDCYLFDLDVEGHTELLCLDAKYFGNVSRFINHSCDPNILPVRVFTDHQIKSCPRIAFFACRQIDPYEEICSDYGNRFWKVKRAEFDCVCNSPKCRYKTSISSKRKTK